MGRRPLQSLAALIREALDFPIPLVRIAERISVLELFHGPTMAFKDVGARVQARLLRHFTDGTPLTILVATSGDTGAAVAAAFHRRAGFQVLILYPEGRVSRRQAHGLECWGDNVRTFRVDGSFDDCQGLAKQALADAELRARVPLSSANSISLGRLLPQIAYYAHSASQYFAAHGTRLNFIVPTGNLGNAWDVWIRPVAGGSEVHYRETVEPELPVTALLATLLRPLVARELRKELNHFLDRVQEYLSN